MTGALLVIAQVIAGLGGLAGVGALIRVLVMTRAERRGADASAGKTAAETTTELNGVALALLQSAPEEVARLSKRLKEAHDEIDRLEQRLHAAEDQQADLKRRLDQREAEVVALRSQLDTLNRQISQGQIDAADLRRSSE